MKTKVEVLESGATKLTVTIEAAEIDSRFKKTYKEYGTKVNIPGFRRGHVPRPVIDSHLGKDYVRGQVTEELVNEKFALAVDECDLSLISQAKFGDVEDFVKEGEDFTFTAEFEVKPELELSDYAPLRVEIPFKNATEAEIDEQMNAMAENAFEYKNAPANTKVKSDSVIDITLSVKGDDGEEISALAAEERPYELGKGVFPEAFDAELVGMKKGESKSFTLNVAENPCMMTSILQGKTENATFEVEVKAVKKKVMTEINDEWVKENMPGFAETVEDLRARIAENIEQQKGMVIPRILENNALMELQKRLEGEAPKSMVDEAEGDLLQRFFSQLQSQGATLDAYMQAQGITPETFKEDIKRQAEDTVKQNLALDAYARHAGITVTDEEIVDEFKNSGAKDSDALYDEWKSQGRLHIVREGILRGKALETLLKEADVVEVEKPAAAEEEKAEEPAKKAKKPAAKKKADKEEAPAAE